jgi:hypothetical protein
MPECGPSVPSTSSPSFIAPMLPSSSGMHAQWPRLPVMLASGQTGPSSMNGYPVFAVMNSEGGVGSEGPLMYQVQMPVGGGKPGIAPIMQQLVASAAERG